MMHQTSAAITTPRFSICYHSLYSWWYGDKGNKPQERRLNLFCLTCLLIFLSVWIPKSIQDCNKQLQLCPITVHLSGTSQIKIRNDLNFSYVLFLCVILVSVLLFPCANWACDSLLLLHFPFPCIEFCLSKWITSVGHWYILYV